MKYVIIALLGLSALLGAQHLRAEFLPPKPILQADLVKVASRAPDTQFLAVVTFNREQPLQDLKQLVSNSGLQLNSFTIATENRTSGYLLRPGQSIDEAISDYVRDREIFGRKTAEMAMQISTTIEKNPNIKVSVPGLDQSSEKSLSKIFITSIEVIGSAQAVLRWQNANSQDISIKYAFDATRIIQRGEVK